MNKEWLAEITPILSMIIFSGLGMFLFYSLKGRKENVNVGQEQTSRGENVFSIYSALKFAFILTTIKIITKICLAVFGQSGFLASSMIASFIGIDAIIINLSEMAGSVITFKEAALALGATHWQAIYKVILKSAAPGILAAIMLGIGRVIGETMVVMMVTGNAALIPHGLLQPVRTMTATIAAEMGETVRGSDHYYALFAIGLVLFLITFAVNFTADMFLNKEKK